MRVRIANVMVVFCTAATVLFGFTCGAVVWDAIDQHNRLYFTRDLILIAVMVALTLVYATLTLVGDFSAKEDQ